MARSTPRAGRAPEGTPASPAVASRATGSSGAVAVRPRGARSRSVSWGRVAAWWSARPALVAAAVYAALALVMVGQGLLPGRTLASSDYLWSATPWTASKPAGVKPLGSNFELSDTTVLIQPFLRHSRAEFPHVPLWNAHLMSGRPLLADGQSAVLSPFNLPAYVLPFWKSLAVIAFLKLFAAAFGTYLLGRALGMRFGGALFAGVVFAFGTFMVVWLGWPLSNVFALIPWLLLLTELVIRRPRPLPVVGLAAVVGLQYFGGHPESNFHALFTVVVYFAFRLLLARRRGELPGIRRPILGFALALGGGTALGAMFILPFLELLIHSEDLVSRPARTPSYAPREQFGALFLHDYWGRPTQSEVKPFVSNRGWYAGGLTLMLAASALVLRPTIERLAVAAYAGFTLIMVLGFSFVFRAIMELPGFGTSNNGKMVILFLLCLALLAGWALSDLSERALPARARRRLVMAAAAAIFCVPLAWMALAGTLALDRLGSALEVAWGFADSPPVPFADPVGAETAGGTIRMSSLLQWLPLAGGGLALIALRLRSRRRLPAAAFVTLAVALLAVDLFRANMGFNPAIPVAHADPPATDAIRYLQSRRPNRFTGVLPTGPRAPINIVQPIPPNVAMNFGLYDPRGFDYPVEQRYFRLWKANVPQGTLGDDTAPQFVTPTPRALRALSLLSVADLTQGPDDEPLRGRGLRVAYEGPDARVYANDRALPRAFLVDHQRTVPGGDAALAAVTAPAFDGRRMAITERALPGLPQAGAAPTAASGSARIVSYGAERVVAEARAPRRSLLVMTDNHFPGWKARVDGEPAPIERVNYLLRGVVVPPGSHQVELRYEPASWRAGWVVSLLAAIALVLTAALAWRARRRTVD
jgi:hypothetical protein